MGLGMRAPHEPFLNVLCVMSEKRRGLYNGYDQIVRDEV